ncbi:hypothetical protein CEXT_239141 [Caerostris extrusa]|uniref:Uncharacterized protein n=1 Tax=Caerostris extrusa TaxID=172846 RepID=A0AAV4PMI7_CAEEX|nr:hypothetical protein CEXT_239141 [Caerostris extrusa]
MKRTPKASAWEIPILLPIRFLHPKLLVGFFSQSGDLEVSLMPASIYNINVQTPQDIYNVQTPQDIYNVQTPQSIL